MAKNWRIFRDLGLKSWRIWRKIGLKSAISDEKILLTLTPKLPRTLKTMPVNFLQAFCII